MRVMGFWLRDRRTGELTIGQIPNPALTTWAITTGIRVADLAPGRREELRRVASGALIAWSADELVRGVNPLRRLIGLAVLTWQVRTVFD